MTGNLTDAEFVVRALEDRRYAAMVASDVDTLRQLLSDRLAYSHSNGLRDSKSEVLAKVADGTFVYESIEHTIDTVIATQDCVLVFGSMHARVYWSGERRTLRNSCLAVWLREPQGWQMAAYQPTPQT